MTLLSNTHRSKIRDCRVSDECSFSDHQLIGSNLKEEEEDFRAHRGHSTPGINNRVGSLTNILLSCYRDACPLIKLGKSSQTGGTRNFKDSAAVLGDSVTRLKGICILFL